MTPEDVVRERALELSMGPEAGTPIENWVRAERELAVAHEYDTADRDLEQLGTTLARLPSEAGVVWRLTLPRGERFEAWEPGTAGLAPPADVVAIVGGVLAGKPLVPSAPRSSDSGAVRLRALIEEQRVALLTHDPGVRLAADAENLHQHRVAARRTRAFLRAARASIDDDWRRTVDEPLRALARATGPARDLDVLLDHVDAELPQIPEADRSGAERLAAGLREARAAAQAQLLRALDDSGYALLLVRLRQPPRLRPGVDGIPLDRLARREFRRLAPAVARLGAAPGDEAIHALRIALKRARYAAELAASEGAATRRFLDAAKTLQDLLGEHQDAAVAEDVLRATTVRDADTAAAFAAGRLAERQLARRARVSEQLPAAWRRLRRRGAKL